MYGGFRDDVCIQAVAEVDRVNVVTERVVRCQSCLFMRGVRRTILNRCT